MSAKERIDQAQAERDRLRLEAAISREACLKPVGNSWCFRERGHTGQCRPF